jgi:hypothetical protein
MTTKTKTRDYNWAEQRIIESGKVAALIRENTSKERDYGNHAVNASNKTLEIRTMLKHCSRSGMMRVIRMFIVEGSELHEIVSLPAFEAQNWMKYNGSKDGWVVSGCGMDMGFHLVYSIAQFYTGDGYSVRQRWI